MCGSYVRYRTESAIARYELQRLRIVGELRGVSPTQHAQANRNASRHQSSHSNGAFSGVVRRCVAAMVCSASM